VNSTRTQFRSAARSVRAYRGRRKGKHSRNLVCLFCIQEEREMSGSRGTANFVWRCTHCKVSSSQAMPERPFDSANIPNTRLIIAEGTFCQLHRTDLVLQRPRGTLHLRHRPIPTSDLSRLPWSRTRQFPLHERRRRVVESESQSGDRERGWVEGEERGL
jgi:hypothetical protein